MDVQQQSKTQAPRRRRNVQMIVRVMPEEKEFIMEKVKRSGLTYFNIYALVMLIAGEVKNIDLTHYHELAKEVSRVGANINQIAKLVNANGSVYGPEIEDLQKSMEEIWRLLKSNLSALQSKRP
jgi:hypothetical protein